MRFNSNKIYKWYIKLPKWKKAILFFFLIFLLYYIFCLPTRLFHEPYSTIVYDREDNLLGGRIATDQQWRFPPTNEIPEKYRICVTEFEDKYFSYHWGINPVSILKASYQNVRHKRVVSGGSTITMQTIRLSRKKPRTFKEKVIEMIWASRMEFSYSKNEILSLYASHAPMGANVVGITAASWRYFGHAPSSLSWAEAATLAVLPNSPAILHFGRNRDKLFAKRNNLLKRIYEKGIVSKTDYELAIAENLPPHPHALPQYAPHLVTKIYMEKTGEHVKTTLSKTVQSQTEMVLHRWNAEFSQNEIKNTAALIIDIEKSEVLAYCGNVNFESGISSNQVDILQSPRSTGSILKPFLYCAMLQEGQLLPNELLPDIPININGFSPKNFSLQYDGAVPASEALARSLNIPFVVSLRKYGIAKFHHLLSRLGLTTITRSPDNYGLSLILGGAEGKLWEISLAYAQMAKTLNEYNISGKYPSVVPISYIYDDSNRKANIQPVFNAGAVWHTFEALTNVNRPEEIDWRSIPSMRKIAWKTGTSFGFRDGWAVGITPKYVVGVWVGNSDGEGRPGLTGARTAGMVMFDLFNLLPSSNWFEQPQSDLTQAEICRESGLLKGLNCPALSIDTCYINRKGKETLSCIYHIQVNLSEDYKYRVFENCAGEKGMVHTSWFVLPATWERFYKEKNVSYKELPPYSPECNGQTTSRMMEFLYPQPNTVITLPKQLDGSPGNAIFEAVHRIAGKRIFWHLDDKYIGETSDFHQKAISVNSGSHIITLVDEDGNTVSNKFTIK